MKRGQIVSVDLVSAGVLFTLFASAFAILLLIVQTGNPDPVQYELVYAFDNLEHNTDFLNGYTLQKDDYEQFVNNIGDIDPYVLGNVTAEGVGLGSDAYDTCFYLTDTDGTVLEVGGETAVGTLQGGLCEDRIPDNPCSDYEKTTALAKPVLFHAGNPTDNRIIRSNLVVCKR